MCARSLSGVAVCLAAAMVLEMGCGDDGQYIAFRDAPMLDAQVVSDGRPDANVRPADAAPIDSAISYDASELDASVVDSGAPDAGEADAGPPDAIPPPDATPLDVGAIASGGRHTCAMVGTGVRCWGFNASGQLGYGHTGNIGDNELAGTGGEVNIGTAVEQVVIGSSHTCARLTGGTVRCWGVSTDGQLGYGNTVTIGDDETPMAVGDVTVGGTVLALSANGGHHTCALLSGGAVRCWGRNDYGQLGYGNVDPIGDGENPASAGDVSVGGPVTQIVAGFAHTCALLTGGTVRCWGRGDDGRLGYGNTDSIGDDELPSSVPTVNVGGTVVELAAGRYHTCARLSTGAVRCWGRGLGGALGYNGTDNIGDNEAPSTAGDINLGGMASSIAVGWEHSCAMVGSTVMCWGEGDHGRLGYGNTNDIGDNETPMSAGAITLGDPPSSITAGSHHTCVLTTSMRVRCWGRGLFGRLGYGNTSNIGDNEDPAAAGDIPLF